MNAEDQSVVLSRNFRKTVDVIPEAERQTIRCFFENLDRALTFLNAGAYHVRPVANRL